VPSRSASPIKADSTASRRAESPRERLLEVADDLFNVEGVHVVGIDRILKDAGVAKASLYHHFGGKDGLVRAYLQKHFELRQQHIEQVLAAYATPRERLIGLFTALEASLNDSAFLGCRFLNASAEARPGESVQDVTEAYRKFLRGAFTDLAKQIGASNPKRLGRQLALLYDGAAVAARVDTDRAEAGDAARSAAIALVDAATSKQARRTPPKAKQRA
jgi:AcrR family transcriptional regulator